MRVCEMGMPLLGALYALLGRAQAPAITLVFLRLSCVRALIS